MRQTRIRVYRNHPSVIIYEAMHNESTPSSAFLKAAQAAAHEEYPGNQMFTCGEEGNNILDVYMSSAQHGVRDYTGSRPCVISEYGDWEHGCVWASGSPITGCQCRIERSAGEAALRGVANTRANDLSLNRKCSWFTADGVWTIFDYQSWNAGPYTASGEMDIFRIPKYPAYSPQGSTVPAESLIAAPETASPSSSASKIKVVIDTADLKFAADGSDIAIVYASILNGSGQVISNATNSVTFSLSGPGALVGTNPVAAIAGIASILIRAGATAGLITVSAEASGLEKGSATVASVNTPATMTIGSVPAFGPVPEMSFAPHTKGTLMSIHFPDGASGGIFSLYNAQGKRMGRWGVDKNAVTIDIRSLPYGVYLGYLKSGSDKLILRIVR
jgi:hypothetical protein